MNLQLPPAHPQEAPPAATLGVGDILFILARHKWKIIFFSLLGIGAAAAIWFTKKPLFESSARILVRYVTETRNVLDPDSAGDVVRSPESRGNTVLAGEIAILTSGDAIVEAVRFVTPERILASYGGGTNINAAAGVISGNFEVVVPKNSSVIHLRLRHPDREVAQAVLEQLIRSYQRKHRDVHGAAAAYDDLAAQTEALRARLALTEDELSRAKRAAGVIDVALAKEEISDQIANLKTTIYQTETALAEKSVRLGARPLTSTNDAGGQEATALLTNSLPSATEMAKYEVLSKRLADLQAQEFELILQGFTHESSKVRPVRNQIAQIEASIKELGINPTTAPTTKRTSGPAPVSPFELELEARALQARYQTLTNQLTREEMRLAKLEAAENTIAQLQRRKQIEEAQYVYYSKSLDEERLKQSIDATKLNNISVVESPTAAVPARDEKSFKLAAAALGAGLALGFGLAFLMDLVLDPSVKRRKDIESSLHVPVFATIPEFGRNGHSKLKSKAHKKGKKGAAAAASVPEISFPHASLFNGEIPPWDEGDPMLPYYEALRDRVVMSYGDDLHKPKIVGLTSCDADAGVTRLATGLAAALSRDVERDVLLICLEKNQVSVSAFAKGRPAPGTPASSPESATTAVAPVQNGVEPPLSSSLSNGDLRRALESLATTGRNPAGTSVVQSFCDLMPKLKVSDYDFIIFDLPPISQTSGSIRLASQMERTLLVVEAEETPKDKVKAARDLLARSKTQLAAVLNKARSYGPKSINPDI